MARLTRQRDVHVRPTRRESLRIFAASLLASSAWQAGSAFADPGLLGLARHVDRGLAKTTPLKLRAMRDYQQSTAALGGQLASPIEQLEQVSARGDCFDVLVVGSGYGGAICGARL